jgi:hypothetical protein
MLGQHDYNRLERWNKILKAIKKPMGANDIARHVGMALDTARRDCKEMVRQGYMYQKDLPLPNGRIVGFMPLMKKVDMEIYQPVPARGKETYRAKPPVSSYIIEGARVFLLTDTVRNVSPSRGHINPRVGSTLGSMTF